jgi:hypothetical protein
MKMNAFQNYAGKNSSQKIFIFTLILIWSSIYNTSADVEVVRENKSILAVASAQNNYIKANEYAVINVTIINMSESDKILYVPSNVQSGFDCKGSIYSSREKGFWRTGELQISKVTTKPKLLKLQAGESYDFKIKIVLFSEEKTRQFCIFRIYLMSDDATGNPLISNNIVVWNNFSATIE